MLASLAEFDGQESSTYVKMVTAPIDFDLWWVRQCQNLHPLSISLELIRCPAPVCRKVEFTIARIPRSANEQLKTGCFPKFMTLRNRASFGQIDQLHRAGEMISVQP
ncbi:MAG: hypothetical protein U5J78_04275 [Parasphingorhabdus sp.]|nr:hypothetical protein [Parasphingorhabdus sp.]